MSSRGAWITIAMVWAMLAWSACSDEIAPGGDSGVPDQAATADADTADTGGACGPGATLCSGKCTNTDNDNKNCGACGTACLSGEVCAAGKCALSCPTGFDNCSGSCVNLKTDVANCGKCAAACLSGEVCAAGVCGLSCPTGFSKCSDKCVNTQSDNKNCGACGTACLSGEVCTTGACVLSCPSGLTTCAGACVNLQNDVANCGKCANKCQAGDVCSAGACSVSCQSGLTNCFGTCVNLSSDIANCGKCGSGCKPGNVCSAGACKVSCQVGLTDCSGACVNLNGDNANCGTCANACKKGHVCTGGTCALTCQASLTNCYGTCVNTNTDLAHCGACGNGCKPGNVCTSGACKISCQVGLTDCSGSCVNLKSDAGNCGACGTSCSGGKVCMAGKCAYSCPTGQTLCGSKCVDITSDHQNCGKCGVKCSAGLFCTASACAPYCKTGQTNCSGSCKDLLTDNANCGKCAAACGSGYVCKSGACTAPVSCAAILAANKNAKSGTYTIQPDAKYKAMQVYCDMQTDGGGWTLCASLTKGYVPLYLMYEQKMYAFQARLKKSNNYAYTREAPSRSAANWDASETLNYGQFCQAMSGVKTTWLQAKLYNYDNGSNLSSTMRGKAYTTTRTGTFSGNLFTQWFNNKTTMTLNHLSGHKLSYCTYNQGSSTLHQGVHTGGYVSKVMVWGTCGSVLKQSNGFKYQNTTPYTHSQTPWGYWYNSSYGQAQCSGCTMKYDSNGGYEKLSYKQTTILNNLQHTFWTGIKNVRMGWSDCTANGNCDYRNSGYGVWMFWVR